MNCSGACAYTLPATQPSTTWQAWVMTVGSTNATIALSGDTFNGGASVPVLNKFRPLFVAANTATSTDYDGDAPLVASTNVTLTPAANGLSVSATGGSGDAPQWVTGQSSQATLTAGTYYTAVNSTNSISAAAATNWLTIMAKSGTVTAISMTDAVLGNTSTVAGTVEDCGVTAGACTSPTDGPTCTMTGTGAATSCTGTGSLAFSAGDFLVLKLVVGTASTGSTSRVNATIAY